MKPTTNSFKLIGLVLALVMSSACSMDNSLETNLTRKESVTPSPTPTPDCPANFVLVPALAPYTSAAFCIAKYEMKIQGQANGNQSYNASFTAESRADGTPWVNVTLQQAKDKCTQLGTGYDLMTNSEWQSAARDLEQVGWNWSGGTVGATGGLSRSVGMAAATAASDDTDPCSGTGASCSLTTWNTHRRVHKFSNGNYIWDMGGNVAERVKDDDNFLITSSTISQLSATPYKTMYGPAGNYAALNSEPYGGLGENLTHNPSFDSIVRSGAWGPGNVGTYNAGIFSVNTIIPAWTPDSSAGFRCAYHKTAVSRVQSIYQFYIVPPVAYAVDPSGIELGMKFTPSVNGKISAIRFYRGYSNPMGYTATLWTNGGATVATVNGAEGTIPGWQEFQLATPASVTAGSTYVASYYTSNGNYSAYNRGFATAYRNNDALVAPIAAGVYKAGSGFPTSSFDDSSYFVDVVFTPD